MAIISFLMSDGPYYLMLWECKETMTVIGGSC